MRLPIAVAILALAPHLGSAQSGSSAPTVTRLGSRNAYGPGIVTSESRRLEIELTRPAHIIVLKVDPDGSIQPVFPAPGEQVTERPAGRQEIALLAQSGPARPSADVPHAAAPVMRSAQQLAREGQPARPRATGDDVPEAAPITGYWLLIASDVATSAEELQERLETMTLQFPSIKAELEALPRALVARRTKVWAAFYAPAGS